MTEYPTARIDLQHRMLAVRLRDGDIAWTDQLDDAHLVDMDADGQVVALDIMALDNLKIDEMGARFGFVDQVPAIKTAIRNVMTPTTGTFIPSLVRQGTRVSDVSADTQTQDDSTPPLVPPIVK